MPASSAHEQGRRKRLIPIWAKALLGLLAAVTIGLGTVYQLGRSRAAEWEFYIQSLREKNQPVTYAEIEARRTSIDDDVNSALLIEELEFEFEIEEPAEADVTMPENTKRAIIAGITKNTLESAREHLQANKELLERLQHLRERPRGRFDLDLAQTVPDIALPDFSFLCELGKLTSVAIFVNLADSELDDALRTIATQFSLSGALDEHPTIVGYLYQLGLAATAIDSIEGLLYVSEPDSSALEVLQARVDDRIDSQRMDWALLGERAGYVEMCELALHAPVADVGQNTNPNVLFSTVQILPLWLVRKSQLAGSRMLTALLESSNDPPKLIAEAKRLDSEVPRLGFTYGLLKLIMSTFSEPATLHVRVTALLRAASTALAAERFRLATGQWPESLAELVPDFLRETPVDPFDGELLRFRATDDGLVIYSVDANLLDDGGDVDEKKGRDRPADVGFRLRRPELRGLRIIDDSDDPSQLSD